MKISSNTTYEEMMLLPTEEMIEAYEQRAKLRMEEFKEWQKNLFIISCTGELVPYSEWSK